MELTVGSVLMFLAESSIQLVPDGTLLIHLLMVGVMVAILNRTLLKPINKILSDREKHILGQADRAQALLTAREQKLNQYNLALRAARTEGYNLLEQERTLALQEKDEKVRAFKEQIARMISSEVVSTRQQEDEARKELEGQAASIGDLISSQILGGPTR
jgi:F-type H+-transporting ATPase subunit b